jgi:peptidyl-prolyl cis-trans isomerase SurA
MVDAFSGFNAMNDSLSTRYGRSLAAAAALAVMLFAGQGRAAIPVEKIVAVVNDEAISQDDLDGRLKLALAAGNLPDTPENRERLTPQVVHALVDDQLRIQEAKRLKISVDHEEVEGELEQTAENNKQTIDQLKQALAKEGVPFSVLEKELLAQISWRKVVQKEVRRRVEVPQEEIDAAYAKMMSSVEKPQYLVAEIFLTVDGPNDEQRVRAFADQLDDQLLHGASFPKLAQQFSQAAGAEKGGDLGTIEAGELPEELDKALSTMKVGQISPPIRTQSGFHILYLRAKGDALAGNPAEAEVHLKNVLIPYTTAPTKESLPGLIAAAERTKADYPNCAAVDAKGKRDGLAGDVGPPGKMSKLGEMPRGIAEAVVSLQVNQMSEPIPTNDGIMMFMVCARKDPPKRKPPTKEQVGNQIYMERLDQQQQRYLSDLRSAGFVDVRV